MKGLARRGVMKEIVSIENLEFKYLGARDKALRGIDLRLERGRRYLLVGASGSGKTTLARCITGLIPHFYQGEYSGEVVVDGMKVSETPIQRLAETVGYLRQNPEEQVLMTKVEREIAFSLEFRGLTTEEMERITRRVMENLGISHLWGRTTDTLSGGELQKVVIASMLVLEPKMLILDEPSAYLSPMAVKNLQSLLDTYIPGQSTLLVIDHRLDYWIGFVDTVIYIDRGVVRYTGSPGRLLNLLGSEEHRLNIPLHIRLSHDLKQVVNTRGVNS